MSTDAKLFTVRIWSLQSSAIRNLFHDEYFALQRILLNRNSFEDRYHSDRRSFLYSNFFPQLDSNTDFKGFKDCNLKVQRKGKTGEVIIELA